MVKEILSGSQKEKSQNRTSEIFTLIRPKKGRLGNKREKPKCTVMYVTGTLILIMVQKNICWYKTEQRFNCVVHVCIRY